MKLFILGAGASTDFLPCGYANVPLPLSNDFFKRAIDWKPPLISDDRNPVAVFVHKEFQLGFEDLKNGTPLSLEEVWTRFFENIREGPSATSALERANRVLPFALIQLGLEQLVSGMLQVARYRYPPCENYRIFAEHLVSTQTHVVSFNWDTLLDEALFNTRQWSYETGYGNEFQWLYVDRKAAVASGPKSAVQLLKPHGSMNWFRYGDFVTREQGEFTGEDVSEQERGWIGLYEYTRWTGGIPLPPFQPLECRLDSGIGFSPKLKMPVQTCIVPPRSRLSLPFIDNTWLRINSLLQRADEIVVIGYGMKKTDSEAFRYIRRARSLGKRSLRIRLVMGREVPPNRQQDYRSLAEEWFAPCEVELLKMSFGDYCREVLCSGSAVVQ